MLLAIDIGNTSITFGIFDKDILVYEFRLKSDRELSQEGFEELIKKELKGYEINGAIIASVVDELTLKIKKAIDNVLEIDTLLFNNDLEFGIKIKLKNGQRLGADRIVNAYSASTLYKSPILIVDMGTATTLDILDKNGVFIGGIICAGVNLQLTALNQFTSKLPKIEPKKSDNAVGNDTESAILSGTIRGSASMIEGLIKQCEQELGYKLSVVATGGYSKLIAEYMERPFDYINPNLTLDGLRLLYELNTKN